MGFLELLDVVIGNLEAVVWCQIAVIGMLFTLQPTPTRKILAVVYWLTLVSHAVIVEFTPVFEGSYILLYVLGGVFDLAIILYTCRIKEISTVLADIQHISIVSILFNTIGLFLAYKDVTIASYMALFVLLYARAIYVLARPEPTDYGTFKIDNRVFSFDHHVHWRVLLHNLKQEKK